MARFCSGARLELSDMPRRSRSRIGAAVTARIMARKAEVILEKFIIGNARGDMGIGDECGWEASSERWRGTLISIRRVDPQRVTPSCTWSRRGSNGRRSRGEFTHVISGFELCVHAESPASINKAFQVATTMLPVGNGAFDSLEMLSNVATDMSPAQSQSQTQPRVLETDFRAQSPLGKFAFYGSREKFLVQGETGLAAPSKLILYKVQLGTRFHLMLDASHNLGL
ncbi:hypothetical protein C8J56DRAFT_891095 [Mycena floridula]|nr:hypothetical protein C8J56DRAFT_891095 [Mycena floridula]